MELKRRHARLNVNVAACAEGATPLTDAVRAISTEGALLLINAGATVDGRARATDTHVPTPLMVVGLSGAARHDIFHLLILY